jgi:hypothetical protein
LVVAVLATIGGFAAAREESELAFVGAAAALVGLAVAPSIDD